METTTQERTLLGGLCQLTCNCGRKQLVLSLPTRCIDCGQVWHMIEDIENATPYVAVAKLEHYNSWQKEPNAH